MAYDYIGLVNDVNRRVNEVELTSANFSSAAGFYSLAKDCVNSAIRDINQHEFTWPFNFVEQTDTLVAGTLRYSTPSDAKWVDYNTFRIKRNASLGNTTKKLHSIDYEWYLQNEVDDEYNTTNSSIRTIPSYVSRAPANEYIVHPAPDKAYELVFEYYTIPDDLVDSTDVPTVPSQFRHVIIDGAMYYVYSFRGDDSGRDTTYQKFTIGIENMRKTYMNRFDYVRDTRINRAGAYSTGFERTS
jgi:hypothetical protein